VDKIKELMGKDNVRKAVEKVQIEILVKQKNKNNFGTEKKAKSLPKDDDSASGSKAAYFISGRIASTSSPDQHLSDVDEESGYSWPAVYTTVRTTLPYNSMSKSTDSDNNSSNASEVSKSYDDSGMTNSRTSAIHSVTVDDADYELRDSEILDSGATLHVNNDQNKFIDMRIAKPDDFLLAGTSKVRILG
jgi:hypothetical protein